MGIGDWLLAIVVDHINYDGWKSNPPGVQNPCLTAKVLFRGLGNTPQNLWDRPLACFELD